MKQHFQNLMDEEEATIDMTPMLDVVFIMLIFFIVTASFVKEAGIDVNRPEAATAVKKDRANILVAISAKGEIWINKRKSMCVQFKPISDVYMLKIHKVQWLFRRTENQRLMC